MITPAHLEQYHNQGFFVLEDVLPAAQLSRLRAECRHHVECLRARMDEKEVAVLGLSHRRRRYFAPGCYRERPQLAGFLFGRLMARVTRAILGQNVFLINQYFTVKPARHGMKFGWHQDSGYVGRHHRPFLSCWCALDDVSEENGTLFVLPYHRTGTEGLLPHILEEETNDLVAYFGNDPGTPIVAAAGSVVLMSSLALHRSGANCTPHPRRVYLAQYAAEPVGPRAKPFLQKGQIYDLRSWHPE